MDLTSVFVTFCNDLRNLTVVSKARLENCHESLSVVLDQYFLDSVSYFSGNLKTATQTDVSESTLAPTRSPNLMTLYNVFCEEFQRRLKTIKEPLTEAIRSGGTGQILDEFYLNVVRDLAYFLSNSLDNGQTRSVTALVDGSILVRTAQDVVNTGESGNVGYTDYPENLNGQNVPEHGNYYDNSTMMMTRPSNDHEQTSPIDENLNPNMVVTYPNDGGNTNFMNGADMNQSIVANYGSDNSVAFSPISSTNLQSDFGCNDECDLNGSTDGRNDGINGAGEGTTIDSGVHYPEVPYPEVCTSASISALAHQNESSNRRKRQKVAHVPMETESSPIKTEDTDEVVFVFEKKPEVSVNPMNPVNPAVLVDSVNIDKKNQSQQIKKNRIPRTATSARKFKYPLNRCHICRKTFSSTKFLLKHLAAHKDPTSLFACDWPQCCSKVSAFKTRSRALVHVRKVHFKWPGTVKEVAKLRKEGKLVVGAEGEPSDYVVLLPNNIENNNNGQ